ncbi:uncharacterized protein LOC134201849 [Bombyx mori]|uniref:uncharacterized protein LOC134201849 n=1 Tax=Bombyx mori TaxID=7091 RepID=UPI002ED29BFB
MCKVSSESAPCSSRRAQSRAACTCCSRADACARSSTSGVQTARTAGVPLPTSSVHTARTGRVPLPARAHLLLACILHVLLVCRCLRALIYFWRAYCTCCSRTAACARSATSGVHTARVARVLLLVRTHVLQTCILRVLLACRYLRALACFRREYCAYCSRAAACARSPTSGVHTARTARVPLPARARLLQTCILRVLLACRCLCALAYFWRADCAHCSRAATCARSSSSGVHTARVDCVPLSACAHLHTARVARMPLPARAHLLLACILHVLLACRCLRALIYLWRAYSTCCSRAADFTVPYDWQ